jgi:putative glutamine amidotransferase
MMPHVLVSQAPGEHPNYVSALLNAGARVSEGYCPAYESKYDALVLSGGGDVDPAFYGERNKGSRDIDRKRDLAEMELISVFLSAGKPVFGICRGHQVLNVSLGGSLIQHIGTADMHARKNGEDQIHSVSNAPGSLFARLYGSRCAVNSAHHQAIDRLGAGLIDLQWSEDGLIEGMIHSKYPVLGVQWHPERMCFWKRRPDTVDAAPLFAYFLNLCREV